MSPLPSATVERPSSSSSHSFLVEDQSTRSITPITPSPSPQTPVQDTDEAKTPRRRKRVKTEPDMDIRNAINTLITDYQSTRSNEQDFAYGFGVMIVSKMREFSSDKQVRLVQMFMRDIQELQNE